MIANPFNAQNNTIGVLIPSPPTNSHAYKWLDSQAWQSDTYASYGSWTDPTMTMDPGEGVYFHNNGSTFTQTFLGEVMQGYLTTPVVASNAIRASWVPISDKISTGLGLPVVYGDVVIKLEGGSYAYYDYYGPDLGWNPYEPGVGLGESFWVEKAAGTTWSRNYNEKP